jgi:YbbR domain-containing protein
MDKSENGTLIVKIICLLLSFGLWLYISNVENPLRTYELKNIPVELINQDSLTNSKFAIINKQQFTVDLKLEGSSSEVVNAKKEDFKIVADMSTYALKKWRKYYTSSNNKLS